MNIVPRSIRELVILLILLVLPCGATTYYVDSQHSSADDANPGTQNSPWKTIQHAAETVVAGDTAFIRAGIYTEAVYLTHAGNSSEGPIVLAAYPGETPIIDGAGLDGISNGILIDKSYCILTGLEVTNWPENAIWIQNADHFEIADCIVHDVTYGIGVGDGCSDFVFNRVRVHHFDLYGFDVTSSIENPSYNGTFNDCISFTGRDMSQNVDGFALGHGIQHDFVLNRCIAYNVYDGFDISSRNSRLNRCLAYNCSNGGYKLWQDQVVLVNCIGYDCSVSIVELDWDNEPGTTTLTNCTFFNSQSFTIWIENKADILHMTNCIVAGGDNIGLAFEQMGVGNYRGDYNLFQNDNPERLVAVAYTNEFSQQQMMDGAWTSYSGQDAHSIVVSEANAIFLDPAANDLHLCDGSAAINQGANLNAPNQDYDGHSRPYGSGYDIGAYEYGASTEVGWRDETTSIPKIACLYQNFPNPFNSSTEFRFKIALESYTTLTIRDLRGCTVKTLVDQIKPPGVFSVIWDGTDNSGMAVPSGEYFYTLTAGGFFATRILTLVK